MIDTRLATLNQYADSPRFLEILQNVNEYADPTIDLNMFYALVWDIRTAQGYGLDVLGRKVGVSRIVTLPGASTNYFGFDEGGYWQPLGQAPFWAGTPSATSYAMPDEGFRSLILAKALANISRCAIKSMNDVISLLFPGRGRAYVVSLSTTGANYRSIVYAFEFILTSVEVTILYQSGVLLRPTGVTVYLMDDVTPGVTLTVTDALGRLSAGPSGEPHPGYLELPA